MKNSIYPCVWCNNNAKEMADYYCNTFSDTVIVEENSVVITLEISGLKLMLLNGGDIFKANPSISLMYLSMSKDEITRLWNVFSDGGNAMMPLTEYPFSPMYGWIEDKFGVSWQLYTAHDENHIIQKLVPTLMFTGINNGKAEEAANYFTSIFPYSNLRGILKYSGEAGEIEGNVQHGEFVINDYLLMMMDSSMMHDFSFSEGVSLVVECDYQEEIDAYWEALTANGGEESMCGWLKDQFGISWQIVPRELPKWLKQSPKVQDALLKMRKLDMKILQEATK